MLVDSHCHLNFSDFVEDLDDVIARAQGQGVGVMQTICTKMHEFDGILAIAEKYPNIYCSVGVHPHEAAQEPMVTVEQLLEKSRHHKVIGTGETGLDFFYEHSPRREQEESFRRHITACRESKLPLIVHTRDADDDTIRIMQDEMKIGEYPGLIHCFSSGQRMADAALEMGFYISVSGIATFKKAQELRDVLKTVPLEKMLIETDAPFLAPMPYRGKRNEPSYVTETNKILAELKEVDYTTCANITTDNFFSLFSKAQRPQ
ncbi:MAG: TatD family hydrolase [Alphaproteobacteria bacterium]|nr:TatD family hydrolase [Alphaproteobacteria bacterium]